MGGGSFPTNCLTRLTRAGPENARQPWNSASNAAVEAEAHVAGGDFQHAVRVEIERDLDRQVAVEVSARPASRGRSRGSEKLDVDLAAIGPRRDDRESAQARGYCSSRRTDESTGRVDFLLVPSPPDRYSYM